MQYIYSKTGDEGSIYAARQGMRACNNNNRRNPPTSFIMGLRMLVLLHALIPCLAAYILHLFSYFLALSSLIPCLAVYILHLFSYFLALSSLHPSTFNGNVFTPFKVELYWIILVNVLDLRFISVSMLNL